jgi:predicted Zn-dependent peptidase
MRAEVCGFLAVVALATAAEGAGPDLVLPPYRTVVLENGLTVEILRHPTVPLVTFELWIRAGAVFDAPGREGLASLTAEALRKGAGERDAQAFALALDALGADFSTSVDHDATRIHLNLLAADFDEGLALLADAVLRPRFDEAEVKKLAAQSAESVAEAKDNPRNVLGDYHRAFLYGSHPYGNPVGGTEESLPGLTAADARAFHGTAYGADRTVLVVAGDLDPAETERKVRAAFEAMPRAEALLPALPEPPDPSGQRVLLVNKPDTPQTWFMIGALGPAWGSPDYAAAEIVRTVFGGRFTSWLNQKLRIETGLTYGARYHFQRGFVAGPAYISTFTAKETTREAMDAALAQLDRLHDEGISPADLASAKAYLKGQRPYDYETAEDLARALAELRFYGLDRSAVDGLFARIDAVDDAACRAVIERWFRRRDLTFTAIGVASEVSDVLGGYGELRTRENAAPGFR